MDYVVYGTVLYQVRINGTPKGVLDLQGAFGRGDPISPYMFILCMYQFFLII